MTDGAAIPDPLTPEGMAAIHASAFTFPRPWSAAEISDLMASPGVFACTEPGGFVLGRVILDEAELLTIAVSPALRLQGKGRRLLVGFGDAARARGATTGFLEVAADNTGALALYAAVGWRPTGRRKGYYRTAAGDRVDAVLMARAFAQDTAETAQPEAPAP